MDQDDCAPTQEEIEEVLANAAMSPDDYEPTADELEEMRAAAEASEEVRFGSAFTSLSGQPTTWLEANPGGGYYATLNTLYSSQAAQEPENRTIFVAYPYSFPQDDYRGVFEEVGEELKVSFTFADERITRLHILVKIDEMMREGGVQPFRCHNVESQCRP